MPRYYFHIDHTVAPHVDDDGSELPDDDVAWDEAVRFIRDCEDRIRPGDKWMLEVRRERVPLYRISVVAEKLEE